MGPISTKITLKKEKRKKGPEEKRKKTMVTLLVFICGYFGGAFWSEKKTVGRKRLIWQ